jgi:hypothetical protein
MRNFMSLEEMESPKISPEQSLPPRYGFPDNKIEETGAVELKY